MTETYRMRGLGLVIAVSLAALLPNCSAGDVELNGSLFDTLGVGKQTAAREVKVPERQGLVLPPNLDRLPDPGAETAAANQSTASLPVGPEQRRVAAANQAEAQQKAFCDKAVQLAKVNREFGPVMGPHGRCDKSILDQINVQTPVQVDVGQAPARKP
jgi:hypothetical protein